MVNTRRGTRNTRGSGPAESRGDRAESRNQTPINQPVPNVPGNVVFDEATMEALRNLMLQTIQSVLPMAQTAVPGVDEHVQVEHVEVENTTTIPPLKILIFLGLLRLSFL